MNISSLLLVDDNADFLKLARKALVSHTDWQIATASSGPEAVSRLLEGELNPNVIVLDVSMPEMDGIETIDRIKQNNRLEDIPIILLTARVQENEMESYKNLPVLGVIAKPFDPLTLHLNIQALLKRAND